MLKDRFITTLFLVNLWLALTILGIVFVAYPNLPNQIPFFYTNVWGQNQLGIKDWIFILPTVAILVNLVNALLVTKTWSIKEYKTAYCLMALSTFLTGVLTYLTFRIILSVSLLPANLPWFLKPPVIITLAVSFALSSLFTFPTLRLAQKFGFLDNPKTHWHPAMLLTRSVARGGALPLFLGFLITSLLLFSPDKRIIYIFLLSGAAVVLGLIDDKFDVNPYARFAFQAFISLVVILVGIQIDYINHPLGSGVLPLTQTVWRFGAGFSVQPIAAALAVFWILWTMNMISWSNGVDGQFPLITAVSALVIGIIGLADANQYKTSVMAFAVAGASLGTLPFSWHPSKILYGFGATGIGFLLATLSILNGTKIATAILVLMVPSLDALFTIFRRIGKGRSPFWGDREHLHHKLLDLGFTQRQISLFYGGAGVLLGIISIVSSGRGKLLAIITAAGVFIFILSLVNYLPGNRDEIEKKKL